MAENPIYELEEDTCWGYLASQEVGRLGLQTGDRLEIFPINYCLDGQSIVFRTAAGTKLDDIDARGDLVFESDGWNIKGGWSVLIQGEAEVITDEADLRRTAKMPLRPWVPTAKATWVRITPQTISGRGFLFGTETAE